MNSSVKSAGNAAAAHRASTSPPRARSSSKPSSGRTATASRADRHDANGSSPGVILATNQSTESPTPPSRSAGTSPRVHDAGLAAAGCSDDRNQVPHGAGLGEPREHRLDQTVTPEEHVGVGLLERTQPDIGVALDVAQFGRAVVPAGQRLDERFTERLHRLELFVDCSCRTTFDHIAGDGAEVGRSDRRQPHRDATLVDRRRRAAQAAGESARSNRHLAAGTDHGSSRRRAGRGPDRSCGGAGPRRSPGPTIDTNDAVSIGARRTGWHPTSAGVTKYAPAASRQQSVTATRCSWVTARMRCDSAFERTHVRRVAGDRSDPPRSPAPVRPIGARWLGR